MVTISDARARWLPAPWLPLTYFAGAHVALLVACGVLLVQPDLPGAFHYHPRMVALTHLVTLGWITGSILGALYIVAPLALGCPLPPRPADASAGAAFWAGTGGMVLGFWWGRHDLVALAAPLVVVAVLSVGGRVLLGLRTARVPWPVSLHLALAFGNLVLAALLALTAIVGRLAGWFTLAPLGVAMAHAHLAVLGWAVMMILGVAYRLVPMFLPAAMPSSAGLAWSAILLECGALGAAWTLATDGRLLLVWVACVTAALGAFSLQMRRALANRRPRPAAMVGRDWSTWQTHIALAWAAVAVCLGAWVATRPGPTGWTWAYGVAGLLGFIAQMVVGIQGRLLPMYAWYVALQRAGGSLPLRAAHTLIEPAYAFWVFGLWVVAVPLLALGLSRGLRIAISAAAGTLAIAVAAQMIYTVRIMRHACEPTPT
jgi:hypothetical protein